MNRNIIKLFFLFLLCNMLPVKAQQMYSRYFFTHVDVRNGLSENNVKSILQDHLGFMWFGTKNGLNRYDGVSIKRYNVDDLKSRKANHNISALFEDRNHTIWVGTDKGVFFFDIATEKFTAFSKKTATGSGIGNWIADIKSDHIGNIWIISPSEGAFRYHAATQQLEKYTYLPGRRKQKINPQSICIRANGEVWIGTDRNGILKYDARRNRFFQVLADKKGFFLTAQSIYTMCDYGRYIALGEHEGQLVKYDTHTGLFSLVNAPGVHYKIIRSVLYDGRYLYAGTQDGLYIINEEKGTQQVIHENDMMLNWLSDDMVYTLYKDHQQNLWIGTMRSGVNCLPRTSGHFLCFAPMPGTNMLTGKRLRDMLCDSDGNIWISTEEGHINVFNPHTLNFQQIAVSGYPGGSNRLALLQVGDDIWSGIFNNGIDVINRHTFAITHYSPVQLGLKEEGSVYALFCDKTGHVWLGTGRGVYVQTDGMHFTRIMAIPDTYTLDITQDKAGNIWVASIGMGIYKYNPRTGKVRNYTHQGNDSTSLSSNDVSSFTIDHDKHLWMSTDRGGVCRYNPTTDNFRTWSITQGLPDDVTYKILEDKSHNLWFGTNHGIVCLNPQTDNIEVYHNENMLPGNQFNYKSAAKTFNGNFVFGGSEGMVYLNPNSRNWDQVSGNIYIGDILVNNKSILPGDGMTKMNTILTDKITLPHDFSNISINVSTLNYSGIEQGSYEYKMEGIDNKWIRTHDISDITYTRMSPGTYTFTIHNVRHPQQMTSFKVIVTPPWWNSLPVRLFYLTFLIWLVWMCIRRYERRQQLKLKVSKRQFQVHMKEELQQSKIDFFTNITHEIRTPLTLINLSVENTRDSQVSDPSLRKNLDAISRNCHRLLSLINQLLDFRKMDKQSMQPSYVNHDMVVLLKDIISRFEPSVTAEHKIISFNSDEQSFIMPMDVEMVTKILSNLLNNAMKYSVSYITVTLTHDEKKVKVKVNNDGTKIPEDKIEDIFQPFSRLNNSGTILGTGIGLPMARRLAEFQHGELYLDTQAADNCFTLQLPLHQKHIIGLKTEEDFGSKKETDKQPEKTASDFVEDIPQLKVRSNKEYTVLLIEDNVELRQVIADKLNKVYHVLTAENGQEGLDIVKEEHVDIVITDIMMPVMDGLEMTEKIKNDIEINHIPVIMLTAKQTMQSQLQGLRAGADSYISKPFSFEHLLTQIETLLDNRKRERESFLHKPYLSVESSNINKQEDAFLDKITRSILDNIKDSEFNVERLAEEMCMSRSSLHRKIKEVSGLTPVEFMRLIKLKKAAELIRQKGYRTTEVCEMIGITSPSYFIKLFQKQFGMTPKEFTNQK